MKKTIMLLCLPAIVTGCATPRDLRGTWRLDVPACKAYYAAVEWPHRIENEWWQQVSHSRLEFSGSTMIQRKGIFAVGSTNATGVLHAEKIPFTLTSTSNGTYRLTYFHTAYGKDVEMTLVVNGDRMEQTSSPEGVTIKYFWRED